MIFSLIRKIRKGFKALVRRDKYYTFKKEQHELILLKKTDDNKIIYNGCRYEKEFFYYDKLEKLLIYINELRDKEIKTFFTTYHYNKIRVAKRERIQVVRVIKFKLNYKGECKNLTKEQYDFLVKAYKYEFFHQPIYDFFDHWREIPRQTIVKDLLPDWLYINGWRAIKPVYPVFHPALYKHYNNPKDRVVLSEKPLKAPDVNYGFTLKVNYEYYHWRPEEDDQKDYCYYKWDEELKFKTLMEWCETYFNYFDPDDSPDSPPQTTRYINKSINFTYDESTRYLDTYNPVYDPFNEGTIIRDDWLDYDEQKKFDEFNINCKTNTYHKRYKYYNEVACINYPEDKKFKTEPIHKYTEAQIKANYENMINKEKTADEKWSFAGLGAGCDNVDNLMEFFELIHYIDLKLCRINYGPERTRWEVHRSLDQDNFSMMMTGHDDDQAEHECSREHGERDHWIMTEGSGKKIHELLTNPQYILLMPVLDAFFEIWRDKGWWIDKTFMFLDYKSHIFGTSIRIRPYIGRSLAIFERTIEYQNHQLLADGGGIQEHILELEEDFEEELDDYATWVPTLPAIICYYLCIPFVLWYGLFYGPVIDFPYQSLFVSYQYGIAWFDYLFVHHPKIYFEFELRAPRTFLQYGSRLRRLKQKAKHPYYRYRIFKPKWWISRRAEGKLAVMPFDFYNQCQRNYYRVTYATKRLFKPFSIWWKVWHFLDAKDDDALLPIHNYLTWLGRKTAISMYHLDGSPRVRWWTKLHNFFKFHTDLIFRKITDYLTAKPAEVPDINSAEQKKQGKGVLSILSDFQKTRNREYYDYVYTLTFVVLIFVAIVIGFMFIIIWFW